MEGCDLLGKFAYKLALRIFCQIYTQFGTSVYSTRVLYKKSLLTGSESSGQYYVTSRELHFTKPASYQKKSNRIMYWYFI